MLMHHRQEPKTATTQLKAPVTSHQLTIRKHPANVIYVYPCNPWMLCRCCYFCDSRGLKGHVSRLIFLRAFKCVDVLISDYADHVSTRWGRRWWIYAVLLVCIKKNPVLLFISVVAYYKIILTTWECNYCLRLKIEKPPPPPPSSNRWRVAGVRRGMLC